MMMGTPMMNNSGSSQQQAQFQSMAPNGQFMASGFSSSAFAQTSGSFAQQNAMSGGGGGGMMIQPHQQPQQQQQQNNAMLSQTTIDESPATMFTHGVMSPSNQALAPVGSNSTSNNSTSTRQQFAAAAPVSNSTSTNSTSAVSTSQPVSYFNTVGGEYSFGEALHRSSGSPTHSPFMRTAVPCSALSRAYAQ